MAQLGLSEDTVKGIVQGSSIHVPLGLFTLDQSSKAVVVDGNVITLDDLKNLAIPVIPNAGGAASGAAGAQGQGAAAGAPAQGAGSQPVRRAMPLRLPEAPVQA
ncbi:Swarming motility protein SwrC [Paenibacillus sp. P1XP2]|nr:Swarming motility protein SwrC [Paenibacillus sp. P1XP2]